MAAAWFGGSAEGKPDVGIWLSRLEKGVWTAPIEVANGIQYRRTDGSEVRHPSWNPVLHLQRPNGPLALYFKVGPSPQAWWGMKMESNDYGKTWGDPRRLPEGILGPIKNKPLPLGDGHTLLCPASHESASSPSLWTVHFETTRGLDSDWVSTGPVNDGKAIQAIQPSILNLGQGRLLALGRTRQGRLFETVSEDSGKSWSPLTLGQLPNPNSGTDALTLRDGRHLLVYNHAELRPDGKGGQRTPLNIALSRDGHLWEAALVLENEPGEFSYPAVIQASDGLVHVTYTWNRRRIRHVVIDPAKLAGRPISGGVWPD